jgi:predicted phosphoribosyltransferase
MMTGAADAATGAVVGAVVAAGTMVAANRKVPWQLHRHRNSQCSNNPANHGAMVAAMVVDAAVATGRVSAMAHRAVKSQLRRRRRNHARHTTTAAPAFTAARAQP